MANYNDPKYDEDLVTYRFLKNYVKSDEEAEQQESIQHLSKMYSSPPNPPYFVNSILSYNGNLYQCISDKEQGIFSWSDWKIITEDKNFKDFLDNVYSIDKIQIEDQDDSKIETWYQETDPSLEWITDILKSNHTGDYWCNSVDQTQWRYCRLKTNPITYEWKKVDVPMNIYDKINGKKNIFTRKPTSYIENDCWIIENDINIDDIPLGTDENPILKGDWVFASTSSDTYNKLHWLRKYDKTFEIDYLDSHYYTIEEVDKAKFVTQNEINSSIKKAKDEISLNVSQNYATKTETTSIISDYTSKIGNLTSTVEETNSQLANLSVENGRISSSVESVKKIIGDYYYYILTDDETYQEGKKYYSFDENTETYTEIETFIVGETIPNNTYEKKYSQSLDEITKNMGQEVNNLKDSLLSQLSELDSYVKEVESRYSSQLNQTDQQFEMKFQQVLLNVQNTVDGLQDHITKQEQFIRFASGTITLGELNEKYSLRLENDRINIYYGDISISNWYKDIFTAKQFNIGENNEYFAFIPRPNGSLSFRKLR